MIGLLGMQEVAESDILSGLPDHQKYVAIAMAIAILAIVLELVRRRKLREEYSFLWIGTAGVLMVLALQPGLLNLFCAAIGAKTAIHALLFGCLLFLMLVTLLVSIRLSKLTFRNKSLSQQVSLQRRELEELSEQVRQLRADRSPEDTDGETFPASSPRKGVAKGGAA